ncbi:hypothetical protein V470_11005 [Streptococcus sp. VT 162]|nr:hypothetical protein V470_11005 [Streptococcus sp. VT 162]
MNDDIVDEPNRHTFKLDFLIYNFAGVRFIYENDLLAKTSETIKATKVLEGKALEADKYEFELKEGDKVVATAKTIPGQGTYTIAPDGTVTFTPDKQFVGNPDPVTVKHKQRVSGSIPLTPILAGVV